MAEIKTVLPELPKPWGYARNVDGRIQISIGPDCPPCNERGSGYFTPWAAMYGGDMMIAYAEAAVLSANAGKVDDTERLDWLDRQGFSYGFEDMHEGNRWEIYGGYMNLRDAIDCGIKCDTSTLSTDKQNVSINSQNIDTSEKN